MHTKKCVDIMIFWYDDMMILWYDGMMIWCRYRCEKWDADVDVDPGKEDGEGGVEGARCNIWCRDHHNRYYHDHINVVNILCISIISCGLKQSFERMPEIAGVIVDHIDHPGSNTKECGQWKNWKGWLKLRFNNNNVLILVLDSLIYKCPKVLS